MRNNRFSADRTAALQTALQAQQYTITAASIGGVQLPRVIVTQPLPAAAAQATGVQHVR